MPVELSCSDPVGFWSFLSETVKSLAWPGVAVFTIYQIRRHGKDITKIIKSVRYKDGEVIFREIFEEARASGEAVAAEVRNTIIQPLVANPDLDERLLTSRPDLAFFDIWKKLENELLDITTQEAFQKYTPKGLLRHLVELQILSASDYELYLHLRTIRNEVVHSKDIRQLTLAEVKEYNELINLLISRLRQINYRSPDNSHPAVI